MHVLIIEAALTGHHSGYLGRIGAAYMEAGHTVTVTTLQRDATHPVIELLRARFGEAFNVQPLDDARYDAVLHSRLGEPGRELALRKMFGYAYRAVYQLKPVDYVFLPYLDYCLYALGLLGSPFGSTQWGGICMRPSFHYETYGVIAPRPKLANAKRALFLKLLRSKTLKSVYTIDELLHRFVVERHTAWTHRLQFVPDPAELKGTHTYQTARDFVGIPNEAKVILVYGAIDNRKGLDVLVMTLTSNEILKDIHLLVVGQQSKDIQSLMNSKMVRGLISDRRCHIINSFVDDATEQMVFAATNIVWLGYRNHFTMSGVLILGNLSKKIILGTNQGLIGWYLKEKKIGIALDINNTNDIRAILSDSSFGNNDQPVYFTNSNYNYFNKIIMGDI